MKPISVGSFEAKTHLASLLEKARQGQVFVVTRRGVPVAQIGPAPQTEARPHFGSARGRVHIRDDFDAPIQDFAEYER